MIGRLDTVPALDRPDLLSPPVEAALRDWGRAEIYVAEIDPDLADTAACCERYDIPPDVSGNCVVVTGRREGDTRTAACVVLATTRADVNGVVRRQLDVRQASFAAMEDAVAQTGMEYGGITPIGLPDSWTLLVDARIPDLKWVVIGTGVCRSKLVVPGAALAELPRAVVQEDLGR